MKKTRFHAYGLLVILFTVAILGSYSCKSSTDELTSIDNYAEAILTAMESDSTNYETFSDFNVFRLGYNIVAEVTFYDDIDLSLLDEDFVSAEHDTFLASLVDEYYTSEDAANATDIMAANGGAFIFRYYDQSGNVRSAKVYAHEVMN